MKYKRFLNISKLLDMKSHFLFGARSTGKSTLIKDQLPHEPIYDLLKNDVFSKLMKEPHRLREELFSLEANRIVIIDEIQKIPELLDEVHWLIENRSLKFLLTGSSARKLKRGGANLLAGRAWQSHLFPLTSNEIDQFDLTQYLNRGGLPQVYPSKYYKKEIRNYVDHYLREEVLAEALTRSIQSFAEFLDLMGQTNTQELNYESISRDCGISPFSSKSYVQILEDTLVAYTLPAFTQTKKRKAITRKKLYFFDVGVANELGNIGEIREKSQAFGQAFEHFIINEIRAWNSYMEKDLKLSFWRSRSQFEVDLIIGNKIALEIKSSSKIRKDHLKGLRALKEEQMIEKYVVVSLEENLRRTDDDIFIYPYREFLRELWSDNVL